MSTYAAETKCQNNKAFKFFRAFVSRSFPFGTFLHLIMLPKEEEKGQHSFAHLSHIADSSFCLIIFL